MSSVMKIVYVKHWLRSLSWLFFSIVVYLYLFVIICMLPCHDGEIKLYILIKENDQFMSQDNYVQN